MRFLIVPLGTLAALLVGAAAPGQEKPRIDLPRNGTTPVITLDYLGGAMKRGNDEPHLVIQADGTVIVGNPYVIGKHVETKIPLVEVQALLRYIVHEQHFFDFDPAKAKAAVQEEQKKNGVAVDVGDGSTTIIRIKTAAREYEVKY